jgi:hypothetical protein
VTKRSSLFILLLLALVTWSSLALFTRFIAPDTVLAFIAFFVILEIALTSTFAPVAYTIGHFVLAARPYQTTIRQSLRQGALLALVIVLNLMLRALHSWNIFTALIILAAAIVIEVLFLARK